MNDEELKFWTAALWGLVEWKRPDKDGSRSVFRRSMPFLLWWDGLQAELTRRSL